MKLHELSSATGSRHSRKRVGRGVGSGMVKHLLADTKVKMHVLAEAFVQDLKVDKTHCTAVYQNVVLITLLVKNSRL